MCKKSMRFGLCMAHGIFDTIPMIETSFLMHEPYEEVIFIVARYVKHVDKHRLIDKFTTKMTYVRCVNFGASILIKHHLLSHMSPTRLDERISLHKYKLLALITQLHNVYVYTVSIFIYGLESELWM